MNPNLLQQLAENPAVQCIVMPALLGVAGRVASEVAVRIAANKGLLPPFWQFDQESPASLDVTQPANGIFNFELPTQSYVGDDVHETGLIKALENVSDGFGEFKNALNQEYSPAIAALIYGACKLPFVGAAAARGQWKRSHPEMFAKRDEP